MLWHTKCSHPLPVTAPFQRDVHQHSLKGFSETCHLLFPPFSLAVLWGTGCTQSHDSRLLLPQLFSSHSACKTVVTSLDVPVLLSLHNPMSFPSSVNCNLNVCGIRGFWGRAYGFSFSLSKALASLFWYVWDMQCSSVMMAGSQTTVLIYE